MQAIKLVRLIIMFNLWLTLQFLLASDDNDATHNDRHNIVYINYICFLQKHAQAFK